MKDCTIEENMLQMYLSATEPIPNNGQSLRKKA